ncbi:hypothetical protein [uncultured Chryseobacterium sp.]|uniref:hypothetical protein n=1 Tax=uncultured Chryseobacterium sp. TaxID=259322 RepID=UPI0025F1E0ED|nr:hypothetical protein [uncultured Chryseobacterium sp.]
MITQERGEFLGMRTALYLFVDDMEAVHQSAVENVATIEAYQMIAHLKKKNVTPQAIEQPLT